MIATISPSHPPRFAAPGLGRPCPIHSRLGPLCGIALACLGLLGTTPARAHIALEKPASWLNEDDLGGPQKGSPCGPGNLRPFVGDDVQPVPESGIVTTYSAGETITVRWHETVYHPGYFRIAIAPVRAAEATTAEFPDPALTDTENCYYDRSAVQTEPHDNVLADGLYMAEEEFADTRSFEQTVTLPDTPCEHCTLQIVQVMEGHPQASCFYFHCAELEILPTSMETDGGDAGTTGEPPAPNVEPDVEPSKSEKADDGCSVRRIGHGGSRAITGGLLLGWLLAHRRRRRRAST